jgi:hypothetical protein
MFARTIQICSAFLLACGLTASSPAVTLGDTDGVVRVRSAYPIGETIERLKKDIADKGIKFFGEIDQSKLAAEAGIKLQPSVLLIFGNPPAPATALIRLCTRPATSGRRRAAPRTGGRTSATRPSFYSWVTSFTIRATTICDAISPVT